MKCHVNKELLLENFGSGALPSEILDHLKNCENCRGFYEELEYSKNLLGNDSDFVIPSIDTEEIFENIEQSINSKKGMTIPIYKLFSVAAAIILVFSVTFIAYKTGEFNQSAGNNQFAVTDSSILKLNELLTDENDLIEQFYYEFEGDISAKTDEAILNYLSEEEINYLEDNFDIEDILL